MLTPMPPPVPGPASPRDADRLPPERERRAAAALHRRRPYPSDVTDDQWRVLQRLLAEPGPTTGRPRTTDLREILSALCYRWRTGCPWRMLPHDFPPWETVYTYYRRWERAGLLPEIRARLLGPQRSSE
jgi:transposase